MNHNSKEKSWIEVKISVSPNILEEISPAFFNLGCQGINEGDGDFYLFFLSENWEIKTKKQLLELTGRYNIPNDKIHFSTIESENWNEKWKQNFKTFHIGKNIVITPDWEKYTENADEIVLIITPKMAFGTGHHETTQLILEMMEGKINPATSVLDAGTGSAILAVYAAKCGANPVCAFDIDEQVMDNARENCKLNSVQKNIQLQCASLSEINQQLYDLILTNINRKVLLEIAGDLKKYSKPTGQLILSGLLETDKNDIVNHYVQAGWNFLQSKQKGEWVALLMENH
jgi:ribosomal protein L11 methyltransferase